MTFTTYVSDFFAGRQSLPKVFWLHGIGTLFVLSFAQGATEHMLAVNQLLSSALLAYLFAWYFALWRTSTNYTGPAIWKYAARLVVLMPLIGIILAIAIPAAFKKEQVAPVGPPVSQFDPSTARPVEN